MQAVAALGQLQHTHTRLKEAQNAAEVCEAAHQVLALQAPALERWQTLQTTLTSALAALTAALRYAAMRVPIVQVRWLARRLSTLLNRSVTAAAVQNGESVYEGSCDAPRARQALERSGSAIQRLLQSLEPCALHLPAPAPELREAVSTAASESSRGCSEPGGATAETAEQRDLGAACSALQAEILAEAARLAAAQRRLRELAQPS